MDTIEFKALLRNRTQNDSLNGVNNDYSMEVNWLAMHSWCLFYILLKENGKIVFERNEHQVTRKLTSHWDAI